MAEKACRPDSNLLMVHQLAQVNIARMRAGTGDTIMHELVSRVEEMNRLAETSTGFVWRLTGQESTPEKLTPLRDYFIPFTPELIFYNMSVWESAEHLRRYVYQTLHKEMLRGKHSWVQQLDRPQLALWWVVAGYRPTIEESVERLWFLNKNGPTEYAFTLARTFPPPDQVSSAPRPNI